MAKIGPMLAKAEARFHHWFNYRSAFAKWAYDLRNRDEFAHRFVHEEMLSDPVRVNAYRDAIARHVGAGDVVIDLGTGTGILAFFAARRARQVHAVEHADIVASARTLATGHGLTNIQFHQVNSRQFTLPDKADVLVQEQIGGVNPLSENMILNVLDLRDRLLKPGGRIIPNVFEIYMEPVEMKDDYRIPFLWEQEIEGIRFAALRPAPELRPGAGGRISDHDTQTILPEMVRPEPICAPRPILRFDLETLRPEALPKAVQYRNTALRDGRIDGLCIYFRAAVGDEPFLDTSPYAAKTSWQMILCRLEQRPVKVGQAIGYRLEMDSLIEHRDWRLSFDDIA